MSDLIDPDHLMEIDGVIQPQPWMQWRHVATIEAPTRTASYGVTLTDDGGGANLFGSLGNVFGSVFNSLTSLFGAGSALAGLGINASAAGNKNTLIHSLQRSWRNNSPIPQWCYGMVTRGGCRVTLQARSRGGLAVRTGARRSWESKTNFAEGNTSYWTLSQYVTLHEIADTWTMRFEGHPDTDGDGFSIAASTIPFTVPLSPKDRITVTFKARRDEAFNAPSAVFRAAHPVTDDAFAQITLLPADLVNPNVWYDKSVTYTVPDTGGPPGVSFQLGSFATAGNLYIGDISIEIVRGDAPVGEIALTDASMFGIGGDVGRGGVIALGTDFAIMEQRMNSVTFPLQPEVAGWTLLAPGEVFTARVEVRFVSEYWEATSIDGGDSGTESSFESGDTRLDLFAVPYIPDPRHAE